MRPARGAGNTLALVWESRELMEIHKQFRKMIARSAGQQAVQLALYATVSGMPPPPPPARARSWHAEAPWSSYKN